MAEGIDLVVMDMAGTTVRDDGLVLRAFDEALCAVGVVAGTADHVRSLAYVRQTMGQSKIEVFRTLFAGDEDRAQRGNAAFEDCYERLAVQCCEPVEGAETTLKMLRDHGLLTCLTTGFSPRTRQRVLERLHWHEAADLVLCPAETPRGRPYPDMVWTACLQLGVTDVRAVAVVGDTGADMLAGVRSGASIVAGVLTGAHDRHTLLDNGASHVLASIAELPDVVGL